MERQEGKSKSCLPLTILEHVQAPLLIFQGYNDIRCPPRSIEVYEKRARELGKNIEVVWFDAGHGSPYPRQDAPALLGTGRNGALLSR